MNIGFRSDVGKVRTVNQDSYLILNNLNNQIDVFAVADGLGGHNAGEVASKMLLDNIKDYFEKYSSNIFKMIENEQLIEVIKEINKKIFNKGVTDEKLNGMGTTLTLCVLYNSCIYIYHVGDSRSYIINSKEILQLTKDHSLVEQLVMQGELTREEANIHPNKNILTRAIGTELEIGIDFYKYDIHPEDTIMLCTDGLTNMIQNDRIKEIISMNNCEIATEILVNEANYVGGLDNITVIVFKPEVEQ